MENSEKYNIFINRKVEKFLNSLHINIRKKFKNQLDRRLRNKPNISDSVHIKHLIYDLYELKIENIRFYYFVYHRNVKIVEFYVDGIFKPFVEMIISSTKNEQKNTIKYLKKNYNIFYKRKINKKNYNKI